MGNRSYLIINKPGKPQEILFEGNNSLAHFWLLLLSEADIEGIRGKYRKAYQPGSEDVETDTDIKIDKDTALENAGRNRDYIAQAYPGLLPYYDEWTAYIRLQPSEDNTLLVDLVQIAGFYNNPDEFLDSLAGFYRKVAQRQAVFESTLSDTTGWDGTSDKAFASISAGYRGFPQARDYRPPGSDVKTPGKIKALNYVWGAISLLMVGGLFYLFSLFPHFWQHILIALLFAPVIYISIKGFLLVEKWGNQMQKAEGKQV
ncbi:hypothetical protein ACFOTA_16520 [Chitinophaga sp. GCM10012297]|uniref:Uncharacterized protein n=1 Tax=Chitinophaga chungangae TaxID=2821488 RepID=A0ABS3YGL7_9BACT|nr:hypothetical protein [Chitinophaga chungangae]MBO9153826.1 hypothetical protein [Chitinophaga chungangae]